MLDYSWVVQHGLDHSAGEKWVRFKRVQEVFLHMRSSTILFPTRSFDTRFDYPPSGVVCRRGPRARPRGADTNSEGTHRQARSLWLEN
ncbi:hypothetical protein GW17_00010093 [Ensete ventricosum]|nr:hypothetical protein GW17_00010093 [Ensete ventricosum]